MSEKLITLDHSMEEILEEWPSTIRFFLENRMACVGCSLSAFDTLGDALDAYDLPQDAVLETLNASLEGDNSINGISQRIIIE
jgi:hybrid cluster-associated redox disulfide protein